MTGIDGAPISDFNDGRARAAPYFFRFTRFVEAGNFSSSASALVGRGVKTPPQLGQRPSGSSEVAQSVQNVHSNEQIRAFVAFGGRSTSHHSQFGLISSILFLRKVLLAAWICIEFVRSCLAEHGQFTGKFRQFERVEVHFRHLRWSNTCVRAA